MPGVGCNVLLLAVVVNEERKFYALLLILGVAHKGIDKVVEQPVCLLRRRNHCGVGGQCVASYDRRVFVVHSGGRRFIGFAACCQQNGKERYYNMFCHHFIYEWE